jgi:hypothetical protein
MPCADLSFDGRENNEAGVIAGSRVVEGDGVTGPVHEHFLAGALLLAQHHILVSAPAILQLAESGYSRSHRVGFRGILRRPTARSSACESATVGAFGQSLAPNEWSS